MKLMKRFFRMGLVAGLMAAGAANLSAQSLFQEALSSFPLHTIRIEYSHPTVLRSLPNYPALRERYEGARLQELEESFSKLGIQESDVDELVLGWQVADQKWLIYGLTSGRFSAQAISNRAQAEGVAPVKIADQTAYCLGADAQSNCVVLLGGSLGAFGPQASVRAILEARAGGAPSLGSDSAFTKLVGEAETRRPIWGLAVGPAVADWFRGWMPNQGELKLDWAQTFKPVEALAYSVEPGETVRLDVAMNCRTSADAASLGQAFGGLRLFQQLTWQNQNPGRPNPYKSLEIQANDKRVSIKLDTPYAEIVAMGTPGTT